MVTSRSEFDPWAIAAEAVEKGEQPLEEVVIGQLAGFASSCWENLDGAGVFESSRAREAVDAALGWLRPLVGVDGINSVRADVAGAAWGADRASAGAVERLAPGERLVLLVDAELPPCPSSPAGAVFVAADAVRGGWVLPAPATSSDADGGLCPHGLECSGRCNGGEPRS